MPSSTKRPSVYEEATVMLTGALVIYFFADLREMARTGEISTPLSDFDAPITTEDVLKKIKAHEEALKNSSLDHEDLGKRLEAFQNLKAQNSGNSFQSIFQSVSQSVSGSSTNRSVLLRTFVDDNAQDELVHAVVVNNVHKRITVVFRGSVTHKDFIQDAKCSQIKVANPVANMIESEELKTEDFRIHTGFYEYLFYKNKKTGKPRITEIMDDIKDCLREHPGYDLFCCGHSLGGALCTLFGFYAAADDEIIELMGGSKPVVIYSFASPFVGNWKFRFAFQHLERQRRVQHLRIANYDDMVTRLPFFTLKSTIFSPVIALAKGGGNMYKHCGIRLQLHSDKNANTVAAGDLLKSKYHTLTFPKDQNDTNEEDYYIQEFGELLEVGKSLMTSLLAVVNRYFSEVVRHHSCLEYECRLETVRDFLKTVTLDDLYSNKALVGQSMDRNYIPAKQTASSLERAMRAFGFATSTSKSTTSTDSSTAA